MKDLTTEIKKLEIKDLYHFANFQNENKDFVLSEEKDFISRKQAEKWAKENNYKYAKGGKTTKNKITYIPFLSLSILAGSEA